MARNVALSIGGLAVAALAVFVASPAAAHSVRHDPGHHVKCAEHGRHSHAHAHGRYDRRLHYDRVQWHDGFRLGILLPHFELRVAHPVRVQRHDRHHDHHRERRRGGDRRYRH